MSNIKKFSKKDVDVNEQESEKKSKNLFFFVLAVFLFVLTIGIVASYFSDYATQSIDVTTGTLKINAEYQFFLNGSAEALPDEEIDNLNPGDVLVIKGNIVNNGNKSAWIRDTLLFDTTDQVLFPFIEVYNGEFTQAVLFSETDLSEYALTLTEGKAVSGNKVINGSGVGAEIETGSDFTYLEASSYQVEYTVYFSTAADNTTQGKNFNLTVGAQALQFRNNNFSQPTEAAWATVSTI